MLPSLSIILPTYKRIDQTKKTLEFLYQSQGWNTDFQAEVILADSTPDESIAQLVSEFKNPTPLYVKPNPPGIAANKNAGARRALHELLVFCDSDMEVQIDTLRNTLIYLRDHPSAAMVSGKVIWRGGEKDGTLDRPRPEDRMETVGSATYIEAIYSRYMATYRSVFVSVGGYDEELFNMRGEGSDLSIRYWRGGYPLTYSESITVHHVHEATDTVTRHIDHPERGIIRDLIQLGYKYGLSEAESPNFAKTLHWLTDQFGDSDKYIVIESIIALLPYFWENREKIERSKEGIPDEYDFKFLDIFTKKELFQDCIMKAEEKLSSARKK